MPSIDPPSAFAWCSSVSPPLRQVGKNAAATRSPGFTRVTSAPTAITSPAPSETGMIGCCRFFAPRAITMSR
jgi:hypothetical protein